MKIELSLQRELDPAGSKGVKNDRFARLLEGMAARMSWKVLRSSLEASERSFMVSRGRAQFHPLGGAPPARPNLGISGPRGRTTGGGEETKRQRAGEPYPTPGDP